MKDTWIKQEKFANFLKIVTAITEDSFNLFIELSVRIRGWPHSRQQRKFLRLWWQMQKIMLDLIKLKLIIRNTIHLSLFSLIRIPWTHFFYIFRRFSFFFIARFYFLFQFFFLLFWTNPFFDVLTRFALLKLLLTLQIIRIHLVLSLISFKLFLFINARIVFVLTKLEIWLFILIFFFKEETSCLCLGSVFSIVTSRFTKQSCKSGILIAKSLVPSRTEWQIRNHSPQIIRMTIDISDKEWFSTIDLIYTPITQLILQFFRQIVPSCIIIYGFSGKIITIRFNNT